MAEAILNKMPWGGNNEHPERLLTREWLVTNGLGGYASGSVAGVATRRYHGLLIAALPTPIGRTVMLSHLGEWVRLPDRRTIRVAGEERPETPYELPDILTEFRLEMGLPVWTYHVGDAVIEKRILLPYGQNTVHVNYRMVGGGHGVRLILRPRLHFRGHENPVEDSYDEPCRLHVLSNRFEVHSESNPQLPALRMTLLGRDAQLVLEGGNFEEFFYRVEAARGYAARGRVWTPGRFRAELGPGEECTLIASTESWDTIHALNPQQALRAEHARREKLIEQADPAARTGRAAELVLAADQFIIAPFSRQADAARALAEGDQARTVIAGYHWFTDWGRDTMISLEGLTISTGRVREAGNILRTFAQYVRDGLIPNMFPEGQNEGVYHTADATLWFFHALGRYLRASGDRFTLQKLLPTLHEIVRRHLQGPRFGIHVDPADGLLAQGEPGYQLTWMDAKYRDWVVTPRRGKAVEINALWYNALRLLEQWSREESDPSRSAALAEHADRARASFNRRFWCEAKGHLYDVVDQEGGGDDAQCRPNQIFALSLDYPILDRNRWTPVLETVQKRLLTPVGLRSLSREDKDYKPNYHGDLQTRDAAYHQGTVWSWLIGPFLDAFLRVHPEETKEARRFLDGLFDHLDEACLGNVSEVFDAEAPYAPRGCIAQAWGVAEVLRSYLRISNPGA
ncbi:MAG: amylo-alpha-1,6-glucosidase [Myxococcales bacterium]